jgi:hypothetical protein
MMKRNDRSYLNSNTFAEYVKSMVIPPVMKVRLEEKMEEEPAVLLRDNCPRHILPELVDVLTSLRVKVATFASNTTQTSRVLHRTPLGIFKRDEKCSSPFRWFTTTITFVHNPCVNITKTLTPPNVCRHLRRSILTLTYEEFETESGFGRKSSGSHRVHQATTYRSPPRLAHDPAAECDVRMVRRTAVNSLCTFCSISLTSCGDSPCCQMPNRWTSGPFSCACSDML